MHPPRDPQRVGVPGSAASVPLVSPSPNQGCLASGPVTNALAWFEPGRNTPPCGLVRGDLIWAALPVDEFPDEVRVASVLCGFSDHPDEQKSQSRIPPVVGPVRHQSRCFQIERPYDAIGMGAGTPVRPTMYSLDSSDLAHISAPCQIEPSSTHDMRSGAG